MEKFACSADVNWWPGKKAGRQVVGDKAIENKRQIFSGAANEEDSNRFSWRLPGATNLVPAESRWRSRKVAGEEEATTSSKESSSGLLACFGWYSF